MPRDLFGNVTRPSISLGSRKWYTVPLSLVSHAVVVCVVVVIPLMATDVVPSPWQPMKVELVRDAPPPPPPPPKRVNEPPAPPRSDPNAPPNIVPDGIAPERPRPDSGWEDTAPANIVSGDGDPEVIFAPPPPPPAQQKPVPIGGLVRRPQKVRDVQPVYPPLAQTAGVQGIVIVEATLSEDGRVINARVLRSVPLLDNAALDAVRQWEFTPTLLNGKPVPVVMTVTVQFVLSR